MQCDNIDVTFNKLNCHFIAHKNHILYQQYRSVSLHFLTSDISTRFGATIDFTNVVLTAPWTSNQKWLSTQEFVQKMCKFLENNHTKTH